MPIATVQRVVAVDGSVAKVGNSVVFALPAPTEWPQPTIDNSFLWEESVSSVGGAPYILVPPQIPDLRFRLEWPTITGTAHASTLAASIFSGAGFGVAVRVAGVGGGAPTVTWRDGGGWLQSVAYSPTEMEWWRLQRTDNALIMSTSPDGEAWTVLLTESYVPGASSAIDTVSVAFYWDSFSLADPADTAVCRAYDFTPPLPPLGVTTRGESYTGPVLPSPLDEPPYDTADDSAYTIIDAPAVPEPACATLLELIQEFSTATRRAVRLTGPTSIEMVDPVAPLPDGWTQADAENLYRSSSQSLAAGAKVLSMLAGDLSLAGGADLVANDVRLIASGWRIPDRLPVYGLHPAPVQRVTYTFAPTGFSASVEFAFHSVPLEVRRT